MEFKYFKITEQSALDNIELAIKSIEARDLAVKNLAEKMGAYDCLQYNQGSIAAFKFYSTPNKSIWKKVKHGFLPKVKTDEQKMIVALPKLLDWQEVIKRYGFGHEMMIGDRVPNGTGFRMHSSYLKGNRESSFYAIVVPFIDEFIKEVHISLVELKEWEVLKAIDEGNNNV
jgi:hypothetical protein